MSRIDHRPKPYHLILLFPVFFLHGKKGVHNFLRRYHANRLPIQAVCLELNSPPEIEIIINSTLKDFNHLEEIIKVAVANSINKVNGISIAVPVEYVKVCEEAITGLVEFPISVISEDDFLTDTIRSAIRRMSNVRYGWILQQFLTVDRVLKSNAKGVLQINSDTYILRPQLWLDQGNRQVLMESLEYHQPYYTLLNKLDSRFKLSPTTHITHHMLFQPEIFRKILQEFQIDNVQDLVTWVETNSYFDKGNHSAICIEFELYAQGLKILFPELVAEVKFSNYAQASDISNFEFKKLLKQKARNYNSMSCHSYLG